MKKFLIGILALASVFAFATACDKKNPTPDNTSSDITSESGDSENTTTIEQAAEYLYNMYLEKDLEVRTDYEIVPAVLGYSITWSVDVAEGVAIVITDEGKVIVDVNENLDEDLTYVLTATVTNSETGNSDTVSFTRKVLAAPSIVPKAITEAPVEGVAYKYHVYQSTLAQDMYFAGGMAATYYFKTTLDTAEAVDVYVDYVEGSETEFYVYFEHTTDGTQYFGVKVSDDGEHDNIVYTSTPISTFVWNAELGTITTHLEVTKNNGGPNDFYFGNYGTKDTISASYLSYAGGEGNNIGHLVTLVNRNSVAAEDKVAFEKEALDVATDYNGNQTVDLATLGLRYTDVAITWAVAENANATVANNVLTIVAPTAATTVVLTATISCGDVSETKEFTLTLKPAVDAPAFDTEITIPQANAIGVAQESNVLTEGKYYVSGVVTEVKNTTYGNLYIQDTDGNSLYIYGCYDATGENRYDAMENAPQVGDSVKLYSAITSYNGSAQLKNAWVVEWTAGTETPDDSSSDSSEEGEVVSPYEDDGATATLTIANYATANSWTDATLYAELAVGEKFTIASSGTPVTTYGLNTGKYYSGTWRIYQNESPSVVISAATGYNIVSVKITYSIKNTGTLTLDGVAVASEEVVSVNGSSITFSVGNTGTATNGQAQITAIEIAYTTVETYTLTLINGNPRLDPSAVTTTELTEGAELNLDTALTAEGKTFLGWYSMDENGDLTVAAPTTMPAEAIALYATWEVIPYTLTIKQDGAEDKTFTFAVEYTNDILISVSDLAYVLEENLPEGYTWAESIPETFELQNYTFTIISIEVPKYTLTLINGNPRLDPSAVTTTELTEGAELNLDTALTAEGKTFLGWYSMDENGDLTVAAPTTMPAKALALYATWDVIPYTLTIKQDGAEDKTFKFAVEYTNDIGISVSDLAYVLEDNLPSDETGKFAYTWAESIPETFELQDYTFTVKATQVIYTIPEALAAEDDTNVEVSGAVCAINTAWNESYGNISVTIEDADGNQLYLYRLATNVTLGDVITVKGKMATHNNSRQIAAGATATITGHDSSYDYVEMTLVEALAADDNANVIVTGTVCIINIAWSDSYGNISVTISDDAGNQLYLYRLATNVTLGDIITVKGSMATYNGARQIAGATATVTGTHACETYTDATCKTPALCTFCNRAKDDVFAECDYADATCTAPQTCTVCGATTGDALGHTTENGTCERCDQVIGDESTATEKTYSYTFESKMYSTNDTVALNGVNWTIAGDGAYWGYDATKGQQLGSGGSPYKSLTVTSDSFSNVSKIVINTSGATSIVATCEVYVGETLVGTITPTKNATEYTLTVSNLTGAIKLVYTQTSSKAIYIKSIAVDYAE